MRGSRPSLVRALVFAASAAFALACSEPATSDPARMLEGRLEVIVVEGPQGGTRYFLLPDDPTLDPVELRFERAPSSSSGARIGVDGRYEGDAFIVSAFELEDPAGKHSGRHVEALDEPVSERTIAFVMVDYGDGVNVTETEAQRFMFSTTNPGPTLGIGPNDRSTLQFYEETSYGLFGVSGGIEGPLEWTGAAACNGGGGSQLANQLEDQIDTDYGHYIWYYGSEQSECEYGWGSLGNWDNPSSNVWFNGDLFDGAITHEIGHNLGYQHASSIDCGSTPLADDPMDCDTNEYGSAVSIMGNTSNGHMMAIEKWYAGWFEGCNAVRVRSSGTFTLHPIENRCGGVQALQIPMPVTTRTFDTQQSGNLSPARYYYLEYRNGSGLDTGMTPSVIVVASDEIGPQNRPCARSVQLDMNPSTNPLNGMTEGQEYEDPAGGVTFSVTSLTPDNAVIEVTLEASAMPNTCMDDSTLVGSGPETCADGAAGMGGIGGAAGASTGGAGGIGGIGGAAGASTGGIGGIGGAAGGSMAGAGGGGGAAGGGLGGGGAGGLMAGASGAPVAGSAGMPGGWAGATTTSGAGGMSLGLGGGTSIGASAGVGSATAGGPAGATGGTIGAAGSLSTSGAAGTAPAATAALDGGCGCRVAGSTGERSGKLSLSLAAIGLLALRRRRRQHAACGSASRS